MENNIIGEWERANPCEQLGIFFRFYLSIYVTTRGHRNTVTLDMFIK